MKKYLLIIPMLCLCATSFAYTKTGTETGYLGNSQWVVQKDGDILPTTDSSYDIGESGAEVANLYVDNLVAGTSTSTGATIGSSVTYSDGAGALPLTVDTIYLVTGGAEALTLADGTEGQVIAIIMKTDGGAGTLTPANFAGGTTLTYDDVSDSSVLSFDGTNWHSVGTATATIA